jgi:lysophospholipase L1-like esterase
LTVANHPAPLGWLHRHRFQLGALLFASVASLALLEGAVRALDLMGISYYEESKRYHLEKIADRELIYAHRPDWSTEYQSVAVSFNALGHRDDPLPARRQDELRILLLGDSVAFGWGVAQDAVFAARLEEILGDELERPVVVVNTGVGSYNTVQQRAVLERHGETLAPDLLLLLYVYNDVQEHERPFDPHAQFDLSRRSLPGKVDVLLGASWLYRLLQHVRGNRPGARRTPADGAERPPGWRASFAALDAIADWSRRRAVPFVLYVWRERAADPDPLWDDLQEAGRRGGFPVQEVAPAWVDPTTYRQSLVDYHPNAAGHQRLAEGMARDLGERGLLPGPR